MKRSLVRTFIVFSFLGAHDVSAENTDRDKPGSKDARAGKRAAAHHTQIRKKYSIPRRLKGVWDNAGGHFYSFRRHDYSARIFPTKRK